MKARTRFELPYGTKSRSVAQLAAVPYLSIQLSHFEAGFAVLVLRLCIGIAAAGETHNGQRKTSCVIVSTMLIRKSREPDEIMDAVSTTDISKHLPYKQAIRRCGAKERQADGVQVRTA